MITGASREHTAQPVTSTARMEAREETKTEVQKLREKKGDFQLKFPELFLSDASIYPSYTNLKLPYTVICRERKSRYRRIQATRLQTEAEELALRQVRAWDGVRIATIFAAGYSPGLHHRLPRVRDPLTTKERNRLYDLMH